MRAAVLGLDGHHRRSIPAADREGSPAIGPRRRTRPIVVFQPKPQAGVAILTAHDQPSPSSSASDAPALDAGGNRKFIRTFVEFVGIAAFYSTIGHIKAVRARDGPDLRISSVPNGFICEAEILAALGGSVR